MRTWHAWVEWAAGQSPPLDPLSAAPAFMDYFAHDRSQAATVARDTWLDFQWLHRHLAAPTAMPASTKPARGAGQGLLKAPRQAA
eukprot:5966834-Heterocapsa_arctica.AAC.1